MSEYWNAFFYSDAGKTDASHTVTVKTLRFSVLTPSLLRVEYSENETFCDEPTQSVVNRRFDAPAFTHSVEGYFVKIKTDACRFCYDMKGNKMVYIQIGDEKLKDFEEGNLKGTCRTLDGTNGKTKIFDGVLSRNGVSILDDSASLIVCNDGEILPRPKKAIDKYYFAYGHHYEEAIRDYFRLTGEAPLIPRFALGNWWSRYKAYTQDEYIALIDKFKEKEIPLSVATIDMDWHWVNVVDKFGSEARDRKKKKGVLETFYNLMSPGWTGYSWNTDLFPDHGAFLNYLKDSGLKITMNLHPASGCKWYEDRYADFCAFMGIDPATKEQISFDVTDKKFMEGYFRFLHHPLEEEGVDFWWIDWQQGSKSATPGLDPLWALNHYHFIDSMRRGKRGLILSRFAGAGSHRYPLGFSGDSAQTWQTLDFQPYFTATASNIGYTWWSHDIGGHHLGERDDELYLRWVQFGVFSPIMRLHSTSNEFMGKEPWKYRADVEYYATRAMRLRHALVPYLYTMNRLTHVKGQPLVRPLYYLHPEEEGAYQAKNAYYFGTELIVSPVTKKIDTRTGLAETTVYLPEGRFTDIFTKRVYTGGRLFSLFRDESSIPVFAKAGAILPLATEDKHNTVKNPETLRLSVYRGNGSFTLYEDDGETLDYKNGAFSETDMCVEETAEAVRFTLDTVRGDCGVLPEKRNYLVVFEDVTSAGSVAVTLNGEPISVPAQRKDGSLCFRLDGISPKDSFTIELKDVSVLQNLSKRELKIELLSKLQGSNMAKKRYERLINDTEQNVTAPSELRGAFNELDALWYPEETQKR